MRLKILLIVLLLFTFNNLYGEENLESLFTRGLNYYIQRQYKKAALEWKKILEKDPSHTRARIYMEKAFSKHNAMEINFYKGLDQFNKGNYKEALPLFKETLLINPRHEKALYYMDLCYKLLKQVINKKEASEQAIAEAEKYLEEEEFTKAIALYKIAILLDPENQGVRLKMQEAESKENTANQNMELNLHLQAAREFHEKQDYMQAIQEWAKALFLDPKNKEAKEGLKADEELLKAKQNKEKINELISKGIDQFLNNQYPQSRETFREVIKMNPGNKTAIEYLDKIKDILDKLNEKKLQENEAEKHFELGVDQYNRTEYEKALNEFDFTISIIPNHQGASNYRNKTLEALKKQQEEEVKKRKGMIDKLIAEGVQLYKFQEYENAIYNFKKVLELDPENKDAVYYKNLCEEARSSQKMAIIEPDSPYYSIVEELKARGLESYNNKDYLSAEKYFNEVVDLFPLNKDIIKYVLMVKQQTAPDEVKKIIKSHFDKGIKNYNAKNYIAASYEFDLVKNAAPDYPEINKYWALARNPPSISGKEIKIHFDKGLIYFQQKDYERAVKEWRTTIELDRSPLSNKYLANALANISKAEARMGTPKAKTTYEQVSKTSKDKLKMINKHYYMGVAYYTGGDFRKALQEFQAVLKIDPNHALALKNIEKTKKRLQ